MAKPAPLPSTSQGLYSAPPPSPTPNRESISSPGCCKQWWRASGSGVPWAGGSLEASFRDRQVKMWKKRSGRQLGLQRSMQPENSVTKGSRKAPDHFLNKSEQSMKMSWILSLRQREGEETHVLPDLRRMWLFCSPSRTAATVNRTANPTQYWTQINYNKATAGSLPTRDRAIIQNHDYRHLVKQSSWGTGGKKPTKKQRGIEKLQG